MTNERFLRNMRNFDGTLGDTYPSDVDFQQNPDEQLESPVPATEISRESLLETTEEPTPVHFSGADLQDFAWKTGERSTRGAAKRIRREVAALATREALPV